LHSNELAPDQAIRIISRLIDGAAMTIPPTQSHAAPQTTKVVLIVMVGLSVLCCALVCGLLVAGTLIYRQVSIQGASPSLETPDASIELSAVFDGCHVQRSELQGSSLVSKLTWVISDLGGNVLLELNAEDELIYRYFQAGTYRVHVKGWYAGQFYKLSDEVLIECP
jgi:hypothetical protein